LFFAPKNNPLTFDLKTITRDIDMMEVIMARDKSPTSEARINGPPSLPNEKEVNQSEVKDKV